MLKSLSQSIKTKWKRALSGLLAVVTVAGMLPATAFAAGGTPATSSATIKPTLCRVFSYLSPGLPRQTSSQLTPPASCLKNMVVTS